MIKRLLPWDGLGHEIVAHGSVLYIGGVVAEDTSLDMAGQADDVFRQLASSPSRWQQVARASRACCR